MAPDRGAATSATSQPPAPMRDASAMEWIASQAGPGRTQFRLSGLTEVAATVALIGQWALLGAGVTAWMTGAGNVVGLLMVAATAAPMRLLFRALAARLAAAGRERVSTRIRTDLVPALLAAAGRTPATEAADVLIDHAPVVAGYLSGTRPLRVAAVPSTLLILGAVALVHWPVAVLLTVCTLLLPLNLRLAGQATVTAGERQLAATRRLSAVITESVRGLPTLVSLRAVARRRAVLDRSSTRLEASTLRVLSYAFLSGAVMDVAVTFAIAVSATYTGLVLLGFVALPGAPGLDLGEALFVLLLCPAYFAPAQRAARGFHDRDDALVAARAIREAARVEDETAGVGDEAAGDEDESARPGSAAAEPRPDAPEPNPDAATGTTPVPYPGAEPAPGTTLTPEGGTDPGPDRVSAPRRAALAPRVDLRGVRVVEADAVILDDLDFTIPAGEWTAISGPSGSGKTTLLQLVAGTRIPTAGSVEVMRRGAGAMHSGDTSDGGHGSGTAHGWLGADTVILETTLAENIGLGDPTISPDVIRTAAHDAGLEQVLADLPEGIDTVLGRRGRVFSAGERRRVALARLLAADRDLWVLDEPTAHLDHETEAEILRTLRRVGAGRTVVIATHSPAVTTAAEHAWELRAGLLDVQTRVGGGTA
ncbi:ATP-binding cassette domain-containing protein [Brevibacterium sp. W7.2]|uniref:ATP-binding cassette domain-containing protein n=1 Tax=Brevibacterium sp. W7.2 TaxID=2823518 RepID=UPI001BA5F4A1|nr:ATP-binding cassette domain-containing protein [Brevibacterium sp. W7.2]